MANRLLCPHCGRFFRQKLDGTINGHGSGEYKYPNCAGPEAPAHAQCTSCRRTFATVEGFTEHRHQGTCLHPSGLGYTEQEGIWEKR